MVAFMIPTELLARLPAPVNATPPAARELEAASTELAKAVLAAKVEGANNSELARATGVTRQAIQQIVRNSAKRSSPPNKWNSPINRGGRRVALACLTKIGFSDTRSSVRLRRRVRL